MKKNKYFQMIYILIFVLVSGSLFAQQPKIQQAAQLGHPMPDFKLTTREKRYLFHSLREKIFYCYSQEAAI
jgi:hypothetical protein